MGKKYQVLNKNHINFIKKQHLFFVATATETSRINLSPKDCVSLYIKNTCELLWLNLTGSGNETAAHLERNTRMTLMFCAFNDTPKILRIYGRARLIYPNSNNWQNLLAHFTRQNGARQIVHLEVELVANSCGFGVPKYKFIGMRDELDNWSQNKIKTNNLNTYQQNKNTLSIDNEIIHLTKP